MKNRTLPYALSLLLPVLLLAGTGAEAQEGQVTGTVRGAGGQALSSVTIRVLDTDLGAVTGADGRFSLSVPAGEIRVRADLIGYRSVTRSVTVQANETTTVDITMQPQALQMGEVVVSITARDVRRQELGTDVVRVNAEEAAEKSGATNFSDLLNARSTGVTISESSGGAGTASRIRIRGSTSLTQDNNPIIYVDGVRVSNATGTGPGSFDFGNGQTVSRLDDIDPSEIASIQVLKGPTAAALYGSEAAAGVIVIETKSGGDGEEAEIRYSTTQGLSVDTEEYWDNFASLSALGVTSMDTEGIEQFRPIQNEVTGEIFMRHNPLKNPLTDPFRAARSDEHTASIRGTSGEVGYYGSLSYEDEEGTFRNNDLQRVNLRGNFQVAARENFDVSVSTGFINTEVRLPDNDRSAVGMITNGGAGLPYFSFGTRSGGARGDCAITFFTGAPESLCGAREGNLTASYGKLATIQNTQEVQRFIGSAVTNWRPTPWLTSRVTLGVDFNDTDNVNLVPLDPDRPFGSNSDGLREEERITSRVFSLDAALTGSWDLSDALNVSSSVGTQVYRTDTKFVTCQGQGGFAAPDATACDASLTFSGGSDLIEEREVGGFFQQQASYADYLFATASVRLDDNSALGDEDDLLVSPSANVSAVLSSAPFWNVDWMSDFRVRAAWGQAAQAPNPFAQNRTFEPIRVLQDGSQQIGVQPKDPGNPELTAEKNEEFEIGADAGFLDGALSVSATFYTQQTTDAILPTDVPPSTGFTGTKFVNIGAIDNQGFEASVEARLWDTEDVTWDMNFQTSFQSSEITDLGGIPPIIFGLGADHQMHREGFSPGAYWGHVVASAERDENGNIIPGSVELAPGNVGDPDRPNDRFLGNAFPGNEQSLSTTVRLFDRLRIFTMFERAGDYVKLDLSQEFRSPFIPGTTTSGEYALRHMNATPEEQAALEGSEFMNNALWTQDATFVKWREATIRYDLPEAVPALIGPLSRAAITVGARNLATFTGYDGLDPELSFDGGRDTFNAAEFFTQPPGKRVFAKLDLVF